LSGSVVDVSSAQQRIFLLDTNVLLYDPRSIERFAKHELVIPITVIEEVDRFKKDLNETGRNARSVSRSLDELRARGSLATGVPLDSGGSLRVALLSEAVILPPGFGASSNDNIILATVLDTARRAAGRRVTLVTRDTNMRIKADALGIEAEDYRDAAHAEVEESYTGVRELELSADKVSELFEKGGLVCDPEQAAAWRLYPNQFVIIRSPDHPSSSAMARYDERKLRLRAVGRGKESIWGISPRNKEQIFALDLLLDDSVSLVTLDGVAGTGKTLMAIACGLKLVADDRKFRRLVVSRPIFPLGRDIGFLPGDLKEKLNPWMQPIFDNLDLLVGGAAVDTGYGKPGVAHGGPRTPSFQPLIDQGYIEVEALTYIRGRSLPRQYLIVDEAQNLTPHEVKTVITRAGEGTKVVLTGDPYQIDNPYVDAASNGLSTVVERFKGSPIAGHVTLRKGERSPLAELAAKVL
jgi:PhoH-like ATPase